jgi:hypothetical protein
MVASWLKLFAIQLFSSLSYIPCHAFRILRSLLLCSLSYFPYPTFNILCSLSYVTYPTFASFQPVSFQPSIMSSISSSCGDDMTSQSALVHLITMILPSDSTALTDFFNHFRILDLIEIMSLNELDFKEPYCNTVSESIHLTPMLVKKLLSIQSEYAALISSFPDIFEYVDTRFLLAAASFNDWQQRQNHIRVTATPLMFDPSPVTSSAPPIPRAPVLSFQCI